MQPVAAFAPALEDLPARQFPQDSWPANAWYKPAAQLTQRPPAVGLNFPARQPAHNPPAEEDCPAKQEVHVAAAVAVVPALQRAQTVEPMAAVLGFGVGQAVQAVEPEATWM